jgi:acyl-CoA thioesterase FadM
MSQERQKELLVIRHAPVIIGREFIDVYGHMNHVGYDILFERERWRVLAQVGLGLQQLKDEYGLLAFMREKRVIYVNPTKEGDQPYIDTSFYSYGSSPRITLNMLCILKLNLSLQEL